MQYTYLTKEKLEEAKKYWDERGKTRVKTNKLKSGKTSYTLIITKYK